MKEAVVGGDVTNIVPNSVDGPVDNSIESPVDKSVEKGAEGGKSNLARNTALAATVLLAPGGFILGSILIARAVKKRRSDKLKAAQLAAIEQADQAKDEPGA